MISLSPEPLLPLELGQLQLLSRIEMLRPWASQFGFGTAKHTVKSNPLSAKGDRLEERAHTPQATRKMPTWVARLKKHTQHMQRLKGAVLGN